VTIFAYWCQLDGEIHSQRRGDDIVCPSCTRVAKRMWTWTNGSVLHDHYNPAFGQVISSRRQAAELAKKASDDQSERLGMTVDYQLTDIHDHEAAGVTTDEKAEYAGRTKDAS
jgi:hypothetical protein